jgi:hypothetical protein
MGRYQIIGADGRQYGPVTGEQLQQWITEGRANAQTHAYAEGAAEWKPLGGLPEFAGHFAPPTPPTISPPVSRSIRKTNPSAMAGLIFGLLAFFCCCKFFFGPLGIIFSLIGLSQINRQPDYYEGRGFAIAGLVLSILSILLAVFLILLAIATGNLQYHWNYRHF